MNTASRLILVSTACRGSVVGVQGTRARHGRFDTAYSTRRTPFHTCIDFTVPEGRQSNDPAGVSILLPHSMVPYIRQIYCSPHTDRQGRIGAVRLRRDDADLDVILLVTYAHPELPGTETDQRNVEIWKEASQVLQGVSNRTVPIVFTDANGRVGALPQARRRNHAAGRGAGRRAAGGPREEGDADDIPAVGPYGAATENKNGALLRNFADTNGLVLVNTWRPEGSGSTYFTLGNAAEGRRASSSRIDYILMPAWAMRMVSSIRPQYAREC